MIKVNHNDQLEEEVRMQEETIEAEKAGTSREEELPSREDLMELLKQKEEEIAKLNDKMLRVVADMDNMRKRLEREREDIICYGNEQLLRELLPVVDNLERAVQHGAPEADSASLMEGVRITLKSFITLLDRFGCKPFDSIGQPFDPKYHEAVMQKESEEYPENTVIQEFQKGYTYRDRLLRPAMVVVSKASSKNIVN